MRPPREDALPLDAQASVNHRGIVVAHAAGANRVVDRLGRCPDKRRNLIVGLTTPAVLMLLANDPGKGLLRKDLAGQSYAAHQDLEVRRSVEITRPDVGIRCQLP